MKVIINELKLVNKEREVEVQFPYYYEWDYAVEPHLHPHYVRLEADGTKTTVSSPDCCGNNGWELKIENVSVNESLGEAIAKHWTSEDTESKFYKSLKAILDRVLDDKKEIAEEA